MGTPLLEVRNVTVSFGGFKAVDGMSFSVQASEVRVLIGPNGAGKSTLLDAIIGRVRPSSGEVYFKGKEITHLAEHEIVRSGICRKFQAPGILESLTVWENLALAARTDRRCWRSFTRGTPKQVREDVEEISKLIGLTAKQDAPAGQLSHGQKQWLEIGIVVASNAELLLLDEPAAGMSHGEAAQTAELIRQLSRYHSFVVIDHDMSFVERLKAPVTVLHLGKLLKEGNLEEVRRDPQVAAIYLGRAQNG
jgi:urea transport system ATP-binding protein